LMFGAWLALLWRLVPALLLTALLAPAVSAAAWLAYRPVPATLVLAVVGAAAIIAIIYFAKGRTAKPAGPAH